MVDEGLIGRKLAAIETYLGQLKEFSGFSLENYEADWKAQRAVERTLQILIEQCVDIANHLISDRAMRMPSGYSDTFKVLVENGVIDEELFRSLERMARFRNLIVHQYEKIDPAIVLKILRESLPDVDKYKKAVIGFMKNL